MSEPGQDQSELGAFLRAELAGVDLEDISLEPVPVVRWQSAIQSRLRAIADYQDGTTVLPVADDMASNSNALMDNEDTQNGCKT